MAEAGVRQMWHKSAGPQDKRVEHSTRADQPVGPARHALSSLDQLVVFLSSRLRAPLPGPAAQRRFAPQPLADGWSPEQTPETARRAAALLLVYPGAQGPTIALTLRHSALPTHGGQISLPGGSLEPGESVEAAAVREAQEEIGLTPDAIRVLGPMSPLWISVSNFVLTPVVSVSEARPAFRLHAREVEALVELPVARLFDDASIGWTHRIRGDLRIDYPYFEAGGHVIWGATAMVLCEFACLFDPGHAPTTPHPD